MLNRLYSKFKINPIQYCIVLYVCEYLKKWLNKFIFSKSINYSLYFFSVLIFLTLPIVAYSQHQIKRADALKINEQIRIDGSLNEKSWQQAEVIKGFRQFDPYFDVPPSQNTEVRILFDDDAIYIGAMMYDNAPDSILKQLGNRNNNLNADAFGVKFDTYNNQNDAYTFEISASGVQKDSRDKDLRFNAVWESAVNITPEGWSAEIRIPYSAIRFPKKAEQLWRIQFYRNLRRTREWSQWALERKDDNNKISYWGELHGIKNISPPLRLSLMPYFTLHGEHYPYNIDNTSNLSYSINGGLDLKWGIDESFTLDMTLLPDFSQVQSDNLIKNLTAFETVYDEYRPFFQESIDLFNKNDLFYSRRIGRIPINYNNVNQQLDSTEFVIHNPYQAKLLNATKISGRNKKGLALGFFNAITDNTYALVGDSINGDRTILTDPLTNYNIMVLDKAFKNSSSVHIMNTNVIREGNQYRDANVTAGGISLLNKTNHYRVNMSAAHSQIFKENTGEIVQGNKYYMYAGKVRGNFLFNFWRNLIDRNFDSNDMGMMHFNNQVQNAANVNYNIYEPFSHFLGFRSGLSFRNDHHFTTKKVSARTLSLSLSTTLKNHLSIWGNISKDLAERHDYYEPRHYGCFYLRPKNTSGNLSFSSDYRKTLALDGRIDLIKTPDTDGLHQGYRITPILRVNDHISFNYSFFVSNHKNDIGYAGKDTANYVFFGRRNLQTIENSFFGAYVIKNDLSINLRARHYWATGKYDNFYILEHSGNLINTTNFNSNKNFNFNSFNIDIVFNWQFAPGSHLSLIWKNAILKENDVIMYNYFDNFSNTLSYSQLNTLTLKILYYIDYQNIKKAFRQI